MRLHVAGSLELFEDHFVHAAARVHESRGHDRQRPALFDIAGGSEESFRPLQGIGVDPAREHFPGRRRDGVVGPCQARDGIQQDDHVDLVLDEPLSLVHDHFGDLYMPRGRFVEGRADDFAAYRALHVGDFFRALVDQEHDHVGFGLVGCDRVGDRLQEHGLARSRRGDDQSALTLADRHQQVQDPPAEVVPVGLELEPPLGI